MKTKWKQNLLVSAALVLGISGAVQPANAGTFTWIAAPTWSYSAAAAKSTAGTAYFWALSVGAGTYSWAYAFSTSPFGSAYSFAEAAAGFGGMGGTQVGGIADPFAGVGVDISLLNPGDPGGYPTSDPSSDPFSLSYTASTTGITFNGAGNGSELNGLDEIQAFTYAGGTDASSLESALGVTSESGTTQTGDAGNIAALTSEFGLTPLDAPVSNPSSLTSLNFTENDSSVNPSQVILIGEGNSASTPEPATAWALAAGVLCLLARRRKVTA